MRNERWVPLGIESIVGNDSELYAGFRIVFTPVQFGQVRASLYNEDGLYDEAVGVDFHDAYTIAREEWPGAEWINREEE